MKVLICDDEPIERLALRHMLNQHIPGLEVVGEAANGRQAIQLAEQYHPDIITMDIKMPGINGLETIHEIQHRLPHARFLLVSAYDTFQYAQEAIKLGVKDYILKPSKTDTIIESFRKVMQEIEKERASRNERLELLEQVAAMTPLAEKERVRELLFGGGTVAPVDRERSWNEHVPAGYVLTVWVQKQRQDHASSLFEALKQWGRVWIGPFLDGGCPVIVWKTADTPDALASIRSEVYSLAEKIAKIIPKGAFQLSVGRFVHEASRLADSYWDSLLARRSLTPQQTVGFYEDCMDRLPLPFVSIHEYTRGMIEKIKEGNEPDVLQRYALLVEEVRRYSGKQSAVMRDTLLSFVAIIAHAFHDSRNVSMPLPWPEDWESMRTRVEEYLRGLTRHWAERNADRSRLSPAAMSYMQDRYTQDIRLEEVAAHVGLSPSYFSRMFKETYGMTFIDALTQIRMEEAKKRLTKGESVKAVAYSVGYHDPNYFTRIFKKVTGVSPREYREQTNPTFTKRP
jgi:two-component system response regulator YesN